MRTDNEEVRLLHAQVKFRFVKCSIHFYKLNSLVLIKQLTNDISLTRQFHYPNCHQCQWKQKICRRRTVLP